MFVNVLIHLIEVNLWLLAVVIYLLCSAPSRGFRTRDRVCDKQGIGFRIGSSEKNGPTSGIRALAIFLI
ncbi:hypothetical protein HanRHA438_Chr09g0376561 [Helianthus annuus]|nr:hypothetical protein HanRHA438_Chr09g0376561 [Helianthus annuus]